MNYKKTILSPNIAGNPRILAQKIVYLNVRFIYLNCMSNFYPFGNLDTDIK